MRGDNWPTADLLGRCGCHLLLDVPLEDREATPNKSLHWPPGRFRHACCRAFGATVAPFAGASELER